MHAFNLIRVVAHVVDFEALQPLAPVDEVYLALGTTIKVAGSQAAFRAVDLDANVAVARAARDAGARRLGLVSAKGADAGSRVFYSRVKGETEDAVAALGFDAVVIARPSLLVGDRESLGQPSRLGERLGTVRERPAAAAAAGGRPPHRRGGCRPRPPGTRADRPRPHGHSIGRHATGLSRHSFEKSPGDRASQRRSGPPARRSCTLVCAPARGEGGWEAKDADQCKVAVDRSPSVT